MKGELALKLSRGCANLRDDALCLGFPPSTHPCPCPFQCPRFLTNRQRAGTRTDPWRRRFAIRARPITEEPLMTLRISISGHGQHKCDDDQTTLRQAHESWQRSHPQMSPSGKGRLASLTAARSRSDSSLDY